jgi:hypothetical protein
VISDMKKKINTMAMKLALLEEEQREEKAADQP